MINKRHIADGKVILLTAAITIITVLCGACGHIGFTPSKALSEDNCTLVVHLKTGTLSVYSDTAFPDNIYLQDVKHKSRLLGGDNSGVILAQFIPNEKSDKDYAWLNIVLNQKNTKSAKTQNHNKLLTPYIDPLPGKTVFGRSDHLPYYWDYEDINPRKKGKQGMQGDRSDLSIAGSSKDGIPEFWDGPVDNCCTEISFATFLVERSEEKENHKLKIVTGFTWVFHEGPSKPGFNNGDESITGLSGICINQDWRKKINRALINSGLQLWRVNN